LNPEFEKEALEHTKEFEGMFASGFHLVRKFEDIEPAISFLKKMNKEGVEIHTELGSIANIEVVKRVLGEIDI